MSSFVIDHVIPAIPAQEVKIKRARCAPQNIRRRMSSASSTHSQWATEPNVNDVHDQVKAFGSLREYIIQIEQAEPLPHSSRSTFRCHHKKAVGLQLHESSLCATEKGSAESGLLGRLSRPGCVAHGDGWLVERRLAQIPARCRHESRQRLASLY